MALKKEEKEWYHEIQKQEYEQAKAEGMQGLELRLYMKAYAVGLVKHVIDGNQSDKEKLEGIKLILRSEEIIRGWIDASK